MHILHKSEIAVELILLAILWYTAEYHLSSPGYSQLGNISLLQVFQVLFVSEWLCELYIYMYVLCICIFFPCFVLYSEMQIWIMQGKFVSFILAVRYLFYRLLLVDIVVFKQWESSKEVVKYQRIKEYLEQFFEKENIILDL